jgi:hypothetical protein
MFANIKKDAFSEEEAIDEEEGDDGAGDVED